MWLLDSIIKCNHESHTAQNDIFILRQNVHVFSMKILNGLTRPELQPILIWHNIVYKEDEGITIRKWYNKYEYGSLTKQKYEKIESERIQFKNHRIRRKSNHCMCPVSEQKKREWECDVLSRRMFCVLRSIVTMHNAHAQHAWFVCIFFFMQWKIVMFCFTSIDFFFISTLHSSRFARIHSSLSRTWMESILIGF